MQAKKIKVFDVEFKSLSEFVRLLNKKGTYNTARIKDAQAFFKKQFDLKSDSVARDFLHELIKKRDLEQLNNLNNDSAAAQSIDFEILNFLKALYLSNQDVNSTIKLFFGARGIKKSDEEIEEFKKKIEQFLNI